MFSRAKIFFPSSILRLFDNSRIVLVYGPEGSGKTNLVLAYMLYHLSSSASSRSIYVSTEGSAYRDRVRQLALHEFGDRALFAEALDGLHLLTLVVRSLILHAASQISLVVIDSINYHYRAEASSLHTMKIFLTTLILLRDLASQGAKVVAVAQVREGEEDIEPSGFKYLRAWCDEVLKLTTVRGPHKRLCLESSGECYDFVIHHYGIQWIQS